MVLKNEFCCRLAVFHGTRLFRNDTLSQTIGVRTCGIVSCTNTTVDTCGARSASLLPITFTSISITGQFKSTPNIVDMPATLQIDLKPLKDYTFCSEFPRRGNEVKINMAAADQSAILSFGFYGRVFENDGKALGRLEVDYGSESSTNTVVAVVVVVLVLVIAAVVGFILYKQRAKYSAIAK